VSEMQGTVLIVDDERSIRLSLRTILSNIGFEIIEAARGEEALSLVRTAQLDGYCSTSTCREWEASKYAAQSARTLRVFRS